MKTGGMAKVKKYREGGAVGMKKPMPAATRSRARGVDKPPMGRSSMSAEQMRDRRESDAEMGNLGTEISDMMRRRAAGFKKGGKISSPKAKKFQAGGPVMGQAAGQTPQLTSPSRPRDMGVGGPPSGGGMPRGGPISASPSMGQANLSGQPSMGVGGGSQPPAPPSGPRPGAEPNMPRGGMSPERMQMMRDRVQAMRDRMQAMRQAMAQRRGGAAPAVMKKGGKVVAKKAGGMIKAKGKR